MGLLTKILDEKKIEREKREISVRLPVAEPQDHPDACPNCHESAWWWDRYGGGPHCQACRPWPAKALVARRSESYQESPLPTQSPPLAAQLQTRPLTKDVADMTCEEFERLYRWYETRGDRNGNGKRLVIERRDWKPEWQMIASNSGAD